MGSAKPPALGEHVTAAAGGVAPADLTGLIGQAAEPGLEAVESEVDESEMEVDPLEEGGSGGGEEIDAQDYHHEAEQQSSEPEDEEDSEVSESGSGSESDGNDDDDDEDAGVGDGMHFRMGSPGGVAGDEGPAAQAGAEVQSVSGGQCADDVTGPGSQATPLRATRSQLPMPAPATISVAVPGDVVTGRTQCAQLVQNQSRQLPPPHLPPLKQQHQQ